MVDSRDPSNSAMDVRDLIACGAEEHCLNVCLHVQLGPLRDAAGNVPEVAGCLSGAGLVIILTVCLSMYGGVSFEAERPSYKTLSGRALPADQLQSADGCACIFPSQHTAVGFFTTHCVGVSVWRSRLRVAQFPSQECNAACKC
jgi:hypothetical protein